MLQTLVQVYASSAVHSDCEVGLESAKMRGFCMSFIYENLSNKYDKHLFTQCEEVEKQRRDIWGSSTSLKEATASTTSFVNAFPTPDDPIRTVGLMAWKMYGITIRKPRSI